jgi:hypothetical protein
VVIRPTTSGTVILNALLAILLIPCLALAIASVAQVPMVILSLGFGLTLLYNLLAGPTCVCHIYTSVQVEKLHSIRRLRTAHKFLARLRPLIEQAQGRAVPLAASTP